MSCDILCSPNDNQNFILVWKNEFYLFSISENSTKEQTDGAFSLGPHGLFRVSIIGIWHNSVFPQCISWAPTLDGCGILHPEGNAERLIAVSTSGGEIRLLGINGYDPDRDRFGLHNKTLISRSPRSSLYLAWNPWKRNLLAQGVDRSRSLRDPCILIWDVTKCTESRPVPQPNAAGENAVVAGHSTANSSPKIRQIYSSRDVRCPTNIVRPVMTCDRSVCDLGSQEITSSFAWLSKSSFIAGMSGTFLKVFDLSDPSRPCQITSTRAVNGLSVDLSCCTRIASYFKCEVCLWNLENLEKPVYTFTEGSDVCQIKWSPLREAWLGVLSADCNFVKLYSTYPMFQQSMEESEQAPLEHVVFPCGNSPSPIVSFAWHPTFAGCLLTFDRDGRLDVAQLVDRSALSWSPQHSLLWSYRNHWFSRDRLGLKSSHTSRDATYALHLANSSFLDTSGCVCSNEQALIAGDFPKQHASLDPSSGIGFHLGCDIAIVMQRRAESGYGIMPDLGAYVAMFHDDAELRSMWCWIKYLRDHSKDFEVRGRVGDLDCLKIGRLTEHNEPVSPSRYLGALAILSGHASSGGVCSPSDVIENAEWRGLDIRLPFPRYCSPERTYILRLCMWRLNDPEEVQRPVFESVCAEGDFGRAATMALFNLNFNWALSFLNRASAAYLSSQPRTEASSASAPKAALTQEVGLVTLAIAGYADSSNELWKVTCASLLTRLENPYLRAMFTFLTRNGNDFDPILVDEGLQLCDRISFACLYLDDKELTEFIRSLCHRMVSEGRLEAVVLTGLISTEFVSLIQAYVNRTGDVQTAAIVGLSACQLDTGLSSHISEPPASFASVTPSERPNISTISTEKSSSNAKRLPLLLKLGGTALVSWVQCYRDLLDQWRMWFHRADFDIANSVSAMTEYLSSLNSPRPLSSLGRQSTYRNATLTASENASNLVSSNYSSVADRATNYLSSNTAHIPYRQLAQAFSVNQVFVACSFCGWRLGPQSKPAANFVNGNAVRTLSSPTGSAKATLKTPLSSPSRDVQMHCGGGKQTICKHCLKPMPRCSICLMHLGSVALPLDDSSMATLRHEDALVRSAISAFPALSDSVARVMQLSILGSVNRSRTSPTGSALEAVSSHLSVSEALASLARLFIWCQACRHGGHASHLADWFYCSTDVSGDLSRQRQCPVSGCPCRCASLDSLRPMPSQQSHDSSMKPSVLSLDDGASSSTGHEEEEATGQTGLDDIILKNACISSSIHHHTA
ncbi:unnamed protein product [Dicrocoelium dendriticum]|nr:unnamed protein product [Dicrocoelium dendriticum]